MTTQTAHYYIASISGSIRDDAGNMVDRSDPTGVALLTSLPVVGNLGDSSFKLTPYLRNDGELWLAATGNGCADDVRLPDLDGLSEDRIDADWGHIDLGALRIDADEIATVNPDAADWLRLWADEVQFVTGN